MEAECADQRGIRIFSQDGEGEASRPFHTVMGVVIVIDAHRKGGGLRRDLHDAVGHTAHGPFSVQSGGDVNAVIQLKKGLNIHVLPPLCKIFLLKIYHISIQKPICLIVNIRQEAVSQKKMNP